MLSLFWVWTSRNPLSKKDFYSFNSGLHNDYGLTDEEDLPDGSTANYSADRILFRKSYLNSFENNKFEMVVPGRTDIQVGHVISLLHPSSEPPSDDLTTVLDPLLSGLYIISAIHHKITYAQSLLKILDILKLSGNKIIEDIEYPVEPTEAFNKH